MTPKKILGLILLAFKLIPLCAEDPMEFEDIVMYAINNNSNILFQRYAVAVARGQLLASRIPSELMLGGRTGLAHTVDYVGDDTNVVATDLQMSKTFPFGLSVGLAASLYSETLYDQNSTGENTSILKLSMSLPLLKSFNNALLQKDIDLAAFYLEQQEIELIDSVALTIINVADAYWQYAATFWRHEGVLESIARQKEQMANQEKIVSVGQGLRTDLMWMQANLASTGTEAILLRNQMMMERATLERIMGLPEDMIGTLGAPVGNFPEIPPLNNEGSFFDDNSISSFIHSNGNVRSLKKQLDMLQTQWDIARVDALPDINLDFSLGYSGGAAGTVLEDYFRALGSNVEGADFSGYIGFSIPLLNRKKGNIQAAEASYRQAELLLRDGIRDVLININLAVDSIGGYYQSLTNAYDVLNLHKLLLESSRRQYEAGLITVNDLFDLEKKLNTADGLYLSSYKTYLLAVAWLKYYTGSLVTLNVEDENSFSFNRLFDLSQ